MKVIADELVGLTLPLTSRSRTDLGGDLPSGICDGRDAHSWRRFRLLKVPLFPANADWFRATDDCTPRFGIDM